MVSNPTDLPGLAVTGEGPVELHQTELMATRAREVGCLLVMEEWGNAPKYRRVELGVESGGKSPAFHRTFRRTPDRLSLAGSSPGCPASVSPAMAKREGPGRESQEQILKSGLTG